MMLHSVVLGVIVVLLVLVVVQCLALHMLLCNELCLVVVEEEGIVVALCLLVEFACRYSYMEDVQGCVTVSRRLMISVMVMA